MQIPATQLYKLTKLPQRPVYLIYGGEPQQSLDAATHIKAILRNHSDYNLIKDCTFESRPFEVKYTKYLI